MKTLAKSRLLAAMLGGLVLQAGAFAKTDSKADADKKAAPVAKTSTKEPIKIGEVSSLTGSKATFGISTNQGIKLAVQEINAKGGIKGRLIELKTLDDQGKPEEAATAITRLISQDKVVAVIGEVASSLSLAMAPIAQRNKIPMISPSSTAEKVTQVGDHIFRVCFLDPFQGTVMAKFALNELKAKKVAIFTDVKNDYSIGLAQHFKKYFTANGGTVTTEQSYAENDIDFKSQLRNIKTTKPDAIFVPGYYTEVGLISRQAKESGLKVPLLGGDGWDSPKLTEIARDTINGSYFSNHYSPDVKSPIVTEFRSKFEAAYKAVPDGLAALGYDSMKMLAIAMEKTQNVSPKEIRDAFAQIRDYEAVTGKIRMDENRNAIKSAVVIKYAQMKQQYQTTINP